MPLNHAPFPLEGRRALLLADGEFSTFGTKTAVCYLRYRAGDVAAVLDSTKNDSVVEDVLGFGGKIPIVATVSEGMAHGPAVAIVGVAPRGGQMTRALRAQVLECIAAKLDIVSGLHSLLRDDEEVVEAAARSGSQLWDVRWVPQTKTVGSGRGCATGARSVLVVGSDCNVGKMTATVELYEECVRRGINASWAATGQTGMILRGRGIAVDGVVSDFVAGSAEELVNAEGAGREIVFVEGQGSIVHPGYAAVTLGLLYGVMPDCMVMAHAAAKAHIGDSTVVLPSLADLIRLHEALLAPFKVSKVVAVAINSAGLDDAVSREAVTRIRDETGLPVCDPVRDGPAALLDAVLAAGGGAES